MISSSTENVYSRKKYSKFTISLRTCSTVNRLLKLSGKLSVKDDLLKLVKSKRRNHITARGNEFYPVLAN